MFSITDRNFMNAVTSTSTATGTALPKSVTAAQERHRKLSAHAGKVGKDADVPAAVIAAILAGNEPASDPGVQRAVTALALQGPAVDDALGNGGVALIAEAMGREQDAIVTSWRTAFDRSAEALTKAHAELGTTSLDDTAAIIARGGEAADSWGAAVKAQSMLEEIAAGVRALGAITRVLNPQIDKKRRVLVLADLTLDDFDAVPALGLSPWELVCAGHTLDLASPQRFRQRVAAIDKARQERADRLAGARHDATTGRNPDLSASIDRLRGVGARKVATK